jgi:hypothetical protein
MAFLNALADVLRPRSAADTIYASRSTGAMAGGLAPAAGTLESGPQISEEAQEPGTQEKQLMLHLSNVSHGVNQRRCPSAGDPRLPRRPDAYRTRDRPGHGPEHRFPLLHGQDARTGDEGSGRLF